MTSLLEQTIQAYHTGVHALEQQANELLSKPMQYMQTVADHFANAFYHPLVPANFAYAGSSRIAEDKSILYAKGKRGKAFRGNTDKKKGAENRNAPETGRRKRSRGRKRQSR